MKIVKKPFVDLTEGEYEQIKKLGSRIELTWFDKLRAFCDRPNHYYFDYFLLFNKKELIGFVCTDSNYLLGFSVRDSNKGHGSFLLKSVIDTLRKEGHKKILLCCHKNLRPFYERFGFETFYASVMRLKLTPRQRGNRKPLIM